jgi:hypothetical protein
VRRVRKHSSTSLGMISELRFSSDGCGEVIPRDVQVAQVFQLRFMGRAVDGGGD